MAVMAESCPPDIASETAAKRDRDDVYDLPRILEDRAQVLAWLQLRSALPFFVCSRKLRSLLSNLVTVRMGIGFKAPGVEAQEPWRADFVRLRLPQELACGPLAIRLAFELRQSPVKRAQINRVLLKLVPAVKWEDVNGIQIVCRDSLDLFDHGLRNKVSGIEGGEAYSYLESPQQFRSCTQLVLTLQQVRHTFTSYDVWPKVTRLKIIAKDSEIREEQMCELYRVFPNLQRLHMACVSGVVLPLCEPGFLPPPDFRITILEDVPGGGNGVGREGNLFVASHLLSLPFTWSGSFFSQVVRLQLTELAEDHGGKAGEALALICKSMPQLRRLGTVSVKALQLLEPAREDSNLEELVVSCEVDDLHRMFRAFLPLEKDKRRIKLRRLEVHLIAEGGVLKPNLEEEAMMCGGFCNIACKLLHPSGFICFSTSAKQLQEIAPFQMPWFNPMHFTLDLTVYSGHKVPTCTPLERPLPYGARELLDRPSGTLVSPALRPGAETEEPSVSPRSTGSPGSPPTGGLAHTHPGVMAPPGSSRSGTRESESGRNRRNSLDKRRGSMSPNSPQSPKSYGSGNDFLTVSPQRQLFDSWMRLELADVIQTLVLAQQKYR